MDNGMKNIVERLKVLIDKNGLAYLSEEPYLTYKELASLESVDAKTPGAIMLTLVRGIERDIKNYDNSEEASKLIQKECCFNKRMADRIVEIFLALYSKENENKLGKYLDGEFEEYCTCDDYYQPVVEDFEIDYYVKEWCKKNGFIVVSCEGDGYDDGYEPSFKKGWY
jgi:hypothetical protein